MRDASAIADSGPLICLARINQLELLPRLFPQILVPPEVWDEVTVRGQGYPGAYEVSEATWLRARAGINSQIFGVEAPGWQGVKVQEYREYSELSQRSQAGCIGT